MAKQTITIQSPCKLSVSNNRLRIKNEEFERYISLNDIWVLILESHQVVVTVALLSALAEAGIGVVTCGTNHCPNGLHLPIGAHSRHSAIVEDQLQISAPLKKRLWQSVIQQKIINQIEALSRLGKASDRLEDYLMNVRSGDTTNQEAAAAGEYFRILLEGVGTRRASDYTAALDYGYAILRAGIARTCVAGGWLVSRGIHHDSDLNAFNLADDFIEPYRPFIDVMVFENNMTELTTPNKIKLTSVLSTEIQFENKNLLVQSAIEAMLDSFKRAVLQNDSSKLLLPSFLPAKA